MTTFRACRLALSIAAVTVGLAATAGAQTNDDLFPNLEWNFSTPGARANGMGRTFIGIADDATAAITNPAGLVSLTRPQIYLEYKNTRLKSDRLANVSSLFTLQPTTFEQKVNSLSFVSISAPINDRIAVGFSLHRFLDHHESFKLDPRGIPDTQLAFRPVDASAEFAATAFGGSVAFMVTNALRVGATIGAARLTADAEATRRFFTVGPNYPGDRSDLKRTDIIANRASIHDTQMAIAGSVGALYRVNNMISVGADFSKSPRFKTLETLETNSGAPTVNTGTFDIVTGFPKDVAINVPDHFGVGVSIRPIPKLLVAADVVRTMYSSLTENTTIIFSATGLTSSSYSTRDVSEFHVGAEYNLVNLMQGKSPLFVRAGVFTNPDHLPTFKGVADPEANAIENATFNLLPRKDETRGTVGAGVVFGSHLQVDAAYVVGKEFVASTAVRF